jgi:3-oxoadipate enol-lactonase
VIVGAEDQLLAPAYSQRLADRLPNATYREITGAGHLSTLEQPAAVNREIENFLDGLKESV